MKLPISRRRFVRWTAAAGAVAAAAAGLAVLSIGWWIDFSQEPVKSDIIVVLAGSFARPLYAADLWKRGYAPQVWIDQPLLPQREALLGRLGIPYPSEQKINRAILIKEGVPAPWIRLFGKNVNSTADEALALRREFDFPGKKILVVTSRFHARRSLLVFRHYLPGADIRVVATVYDDFDRRWWRHKELAINAVSEILKTLYYFLGLRFVARP